MCGWKIYIRYRRGDIQHTRHGHMCYNNNNRMSCPIYDVATAAPYIVVTHTHNAFNVWITEYRLNVLCTVGSPERSFLSFSNQEKQWTQLKSKFERFIIKNTFCRANMIFREKSRQANSNFRNFFSCGGDKCQKEETVLPYYCSACSIWWVFVWLLWTCCELL